MSGIPTCFIGKNCLLGEGIKSLLKKHGYTPLIEFYDVGQFSASHDFEKIHLALICSDLETDIRNGIKFCKENLKKARVAVLTQALDQSALYESYQAGADGYILKDVSADAFIGSINLIMAGQKVFPPALCFNMKPVFGAFSGMLLKPNFHEESELSSREVDIVKCLAEGHSNKLIAKELDIAESTVKIHLKAILRKLGLSNRTQAAIWAVKRGFSPAADFASQS
jgi:two-component system nitrate/nitrite response regulator NarL